MALLAAGKIDGYASDRLLLVELGLNSKGSSSFRVLDEDFSVEPYALTLPRGEPDLRLAVNRAPGPAVPEHGDRAHLREVAGRAGPAQRPVELRCTTCRASPSSPDRSRRRRSSRIDHAHTDPYCCSVIAGSGWLAAAFAAQDLSVPPPMPADTPPSSSAPQADQASGSGQGPLYQLWRDPLDQADRDRAPAGRCADATSAPSSTCSSATSPSRSSGRSWASPSAKARPPPRSSARPGARPCAGASCRSPTKSPSPSTTAASA